MSVAVRPMIPLVAPTITVHDRANMLAALADGVLENEHAVQRFEEAFAERVGCDWAVAVNSGTVALEIALDVLGTDIVGIPTYSCVALRNACHEKRIRYMDSSFDVPTQTLTVGPTEANTEIVSHAFGMPAVYGRRIAIEDWTLSLGGVPALNGVLGVCSTHASKMISTGRGGVIFGDHNVRDLVHRLAHYETHTDYGYSAAMSSTQAQLGISQLEQLDAFIERRRDLAAFYSYRFASAGIECPDPDSGSVFFRYMIGVEQDPAGLVVELAGRGIQAGRGVHPLLHRLAGLSDEGFPGVVDSVTRLLSVPVHPSITDTEAAYIAEQIVEVCAP